MKYSANEMTLRATPRAAPIRSTTVVRIASLPTIPPRPNASVDVRECKRRRPRHRSRQLFPPRRRFPRARPRRERHERDERRHRLRSRPERARHDDDGDVDVNQTQPREQHDVRLRARARAADEAGVASGPSGSIDRVRTVARATRSARGRRRAVDSRERRPTPRRVTFKSPRRSAAATRIDTLRCRGGRARYI